MSTSTPPPPPPPLPPKSPSLAPSTRTYKSTNTISSSGFTHTTEFQSPSRPTHAQRGIRTNASSIHLTGPMVLDGNGQDPFVMQNEEEEDDWVSESELANLPWAEPPPRDPSPYPIPLHRQPSLSFLTSDPAKGTFNDTTISRKSSKSSIASRRSQNHPHPVSLPTYLHPELGSHRFSAQTMHSFQSGMADVELDSVSHSAEVGVEQLNPTPPKVKDDSPRSAMAVRPSSPLSHRSNSIGSMFRKARSLKSTKSGKSIASSKKRISNSTIHRKSFQRAYGKWDLVEMSPLLEEDARRREEELGLSALLGRATVLERMLKAGRRVSGPNVPSLKRFTSRSTKSSRPSPLETPRSARTLSTRSLRHPFRQREDQFTEIDSQSNHDSITPTILPTPQLQLQDEKERHWVVLIPEKNLPIEDDNSPNTCVSFICASNAEKTLPEEEVERARYIQSPHLGHREADHRNRQSVLSYISVGRWSSSTRGGRRRRKYVLGISIGCVVGVILLTGLLAGLLARRHKDGA